jgi:hypothetical protein
VPVDVVTVSGHPTVPSDGHVMIPPGRSNAPINVVAPAASTANNGGTRNDAPQGMVGKDVLATLLASMESILVSKLADLCTDLMVSVESMMETKRADVRNDLKELKDTVNKHVFTTQFSTMTQSKLSKRQYEAGYLFPPVPAETPSAAENRGAALPHVSSTRQRAQTPAVAPKTGRQRASNTWAIRQQYAADCRLAARVHAARRPALQRMPVHAPSAGLNLSLETHEAVTLTG